MFEYAGAPQPLEEIFGSSSGFIHRDDGALVAGEPHVASSWFPANDHPTDRASFRCDITVPAGLEMAANGSLAGESTEGGRRGAGMRPSRWQPTSPVWRSAS